MILTVDIGNTNIVFGGLEKGKVLFTGRIKTSRKISADDIAAKISSIMKLNSAPKAEGGIISSVVPYLTGKAERAVRGVTGKRALTVGKNADIGIDILMDEPDRVGVDMLVDAVGAMEKYRPPFIIFDMGTASTCSVIDKEGRYVGTIIAPGVFISLNALSSRCAALPKIRLEDPGSILSKNTKQSMRSGIIYGNAAMMDGIADRIFDELGYKTRIIATGGVSRAIVPYCRHKMEYDPNLMLKGLEAIWERNRSAALYERAGKPAGVY